MQALLSVALEQHRRGELAEAARHYRTILEDRPEHPDANHLLGVVSIQGGDPGRAVALIGRAIALAPREAAFHGNLAEAFRRLRQPDRAIAAAKAALALRPRFPEAANTLGLALADLGRFDEAVDRYEEALRFRPEFAAASNNLGNAHLARKDPNRAVAAFRRAVELDSNLAEAHSNLGQLLLERDEAEAAQVHCEAAVRLRPGFAEALSNLGNVLRRRGRLVEARRCYVDAIAMAPHLGMVHNNLGQALQEENRLDEAIARYGEALRLESGSARFHANLASVLAEQDNHVQAAAEFETALVLDPADLAAHNGLGEVRREQRRYEEARACFERAMELDPAEPTARCALGILLEEQGDLAAAQACFRQVLDRDPNHVGALVQSATLLKDKLPVEELAAMARRLEDPEIRDAGRSSLHFGLAQSLDARGDFDGAAAHLERANAHALAETRRLDRGYDPVRHTRLVQNALRAACTSESLAALNGLGSDSERPVFIFGLPRSGTTLTEQVLASHSRVHGSGELPLAREAFDALPATLGLDLEPAACLGRLDATAARRLAAAHLDCLSALDATADRVVDKMPDNYLYLGLLATLFPRARFIHCRRDLRDVAVSCWMTHFRQIRWANDPAHIAHRFKNYVGLMDHWRSALPVPVLEVSYEEMVADLEGQARRLLSFCGLDWEPSCLAFHETSRPVRTASVAQVRRPIYNRSVARWRHYELALASLFAMLPETH